MTCFQGLVKAKKIAVETTQGAFQLQWVPTSPALYFPLP